MSIVTRRSAITGLGIALATPPLATPPLASPALAQSADVMDLLATVNMHGIQTSGNCIRNTTTDEFEQAVSSWITSARHPQSGRPFTEMVYQPMLELLAFLRHHQFKTFIVSGGGIEFVRPWAERVYGIPPEQVVGSTGRVTYELRDTGPVLVKTLDYLFVDDKAGKPAGIHQFIGRRPIIAFGNSDGDTQMLEYTTIDNPQPSLGVLIHHTDAVREYQYDVNPTSSGTLVKALADAPQRGWTVVSMKDDWEQIFSAP
jgi:hypothetical protein